MSRQFADQHLHKHFWRGDRRFQGQIGPGNLFQPGDEATVVDPARLLVQMGDGIGRKADRLSHLGVGAVEAHQVLGDEQATVVAGDRPDDHQ